MNTIKALFQRKSNQKGWGGKGEDVAAKFLKKSGMKILERNWANAKGKRIGEIDIIASEGEAIVFVEVKSRYSELADESLQPEENITPAKIAKLAKIAEYYIAKKSFWEKEWRLDAITVIFSEERDPAINHIKHIF